MLRTGAKIYILLEIAAGIAVGFLAIFVIAGFCLNNGLACHPFVIVGAVIAGVFCIGALLNAVREFFNVIKE